jgi:CBS domain-containing protein
MTMQPHFRTVGEITLTNALATTEETSAHAVAMKLLQVGHQGLPVLDRQGLVVGKITEIHLLRALKDGRNLKNTAVKEIMAPPPPVVSAETPLEVAMEIMEAHRLLRLPVMRGNRFLGSVTRHDLLRAWLGVWVDHHSASYAPVIG